MSFEEKLDQFRTERDAIDELSATGRLTAADERQARESLASKFSGETSDGDTIHDQPHPPVHPGLSAATEPLPTPGILAARCPPGWRRDPMNGWPVMPCLGKLLFPCAPEGVPGVTDVSKAVSRLRSWVSAHSKAEPFDVIDDAVDLIGGVLLDAAMAKKRGGDGLSQNTEVRLSSLVESMLRTCGTVSIRRTAGGWEEVADA